MKLSDILHEKAIIHEMQSRDKHGSLEELAQVASNATGMDFHQILEVLEERESLGSTGIGGGIAIPHGKPANMETVFLGLGISQNGVDYDSLDNKPVHIFFVILTPEHSTGGHLKVLAQVSRLLKQESFKQALIAAKTPKEIFDLVGEQDEEF